MEQAHPTPEMLANQQRTRSSGLKMAPSSSMPTTSNSACIEVFLKVTLQYSKICSLNPTRHAISRSVASSTVSYVRLSNSRTPLMTYGTFCVDAYRGMPEGTFDAKWSPASIFTPTPPRSLGTTVTPSFAMVSAAVRLGQKYKFTDMHEKALAFLKSHYTDSLDIWLSRGLDWSPDGWSASEAIGVINLAKLTGERSLLPTAFMACAIALRGSLIRGFTREDGSQEHLALRDIGRCLNAQIRLREASVAALFRVLTPTVASACKAPSQCAKTLQKALRGNNVEANVNVMMTGDFLLNTPKSHLKTKDGKSSICKACTAMIKKRDKEENRALWDRLPALLGIKVPEWVKPAAAPAPAATREVLVMLSK